MQHRAPADAHNQPRRRVLASVAVAATVLVLLGLAPARAQRAPATALEAAAERIFSARPGETRALIVQQAGRTLHERYGEGFDARTPFVSWSVAKSVLATALGILVAEGRVELDRAAPVEAWRRPGDPRGPITVRHLLTMTAGLDHREGGEGGLPIETADTVRMLFGDGGADTARHAAARPVSYPAGTHWRYSTGASQILADIIARAITSQSDPAARRRDTVAWFQDRLFAPLRIRSAHWDFDAAGLFLGGSMLHMTAADYARMGDLYLARGRTSDGAAVIPAAWVDIVTAPVPAGNSANYGGHFWINAKAAPGQPNAMFHPRGTPRAFAMIGHLGQFVIVVPEKRAVIVRLGKTANKDRPALRDDLGALIDALETTP